MPTPPTPIAQAVRLLRAAAKDIKDCHTRGDEDWSGEPEALAAHDEHLAAAQALELIEQPGDDLTKRLIAACRHTTLTWEDRRAVGEAIARLQAAMVGAPAPVPTDAQLLALNEGERNFSESPSKYPEAGFGTQYHGGAPGVLQFARAVLALGGV